MHELSIARCLIETAEEEARQNNARVIRLVRCRIGTLRQVDDWLLQEAFNAARQGTICAESCLQIERSDLTAQCPKCIVRFPIESDHWLCPTCGSVGENFSGGEELELTSIDVELNDKPTQDDHESAATCNMGAVR